jgi:hypothetical protein
MSKLFQKVWHMATCQNQLLHFPYGENFEQYITEKSGFIGLDGLTTDIWGASFGTLK